MGSTQLQLTASPKWTRQDPNTDGLATGFELLHVQPHQKAVIEHLITRYTFEGGTIFDKDEG